MAKKKFNLSTILTAVGALLGLAAFFMLFAPAIAVKDSETTYTGLKVTFGMKQTFLGKEYTVWKFSFMNLLTYILALAGIVLALLNAKKPGKLFALISAACFLVAGIFFFCATSFASFNEDVSSLIAWAGGNVKDSLTLGAGSIVGGILSILAAICAASPFVVK